MIKVLNILTTGLCIDGISNSIMNYYRNINKNVIHIDFVAQSVVDSIKEEVEQDGHNVYIINGRKKNPIKYVKKLSKLIKENEYEIVHAHGSSSILCLEMIAAKMAGCKIRIAHSRNTKANHKIIDRVLRPVFYRTYTHGFACGEDAGKWLFKGRKFEVVNNGKDIEQFQYDEEIRKKVRQENSISDKIVIGHVGAFNYQKNHEFLIDVFYDLVKSNPNYFLILIGRGHLQEEIKQKVKKLGIENNVLFVGRTFEVSKWLQAMDIMVFPSRFEGFPNVLVEWQIAGLPSVISNKITKEVALTRLVHFASIEDSPEKWAEIIEKIEIEDREKNKQEILQEIRNKGFDIKENAKKLEDIYQKVYKNIYER